MLAPLKSRLEKLICPVQKRPEHAPALAPLSVLPQGSRPSFSSNTETPRLKLDFVIRYRGKCVPVEVKARDGNAKSVKTVLKHPEKYRVDSAIKLADLNIGRTGVILTLPLYMAFLLTER